MTSDSGSGTDDQETTRMPPDQVPPSQVPPGWASGAQRPPEPPQYPQQPYPGPPPYAAQPPYQPDYAQAPGYQSPGYQQPQGYPQSPGYQQAPAYQQPPGYQGQPSYQGQQPGAPAYGAYQQPGAPMYPGSDFSGRPPKGSGGWSGFAIAAFVVGLVIPLLGLLIAVPLAIVALVKIPKRGQRGKVLAILGIVFSVLWWIVIIAIGVYYNTHQAKRDSSGVIVKAGYLSFGDVKVGDCVVIKGLNGSDDTVSGNLKGVPCSESHNAQAGGVVPSTATSYPGYQAMNQAAQQSCSTQIGSWIDSSQTTGLEQYTLAPTESLWKSGDSNHEVLCFVIRTDFGNMTGSVAAK